MADVSATWTSPTGSQCVATGSGGHSVVMDAPNGRAEWAGIKPSELLLAALLGCTGVDFTSILAKQRQVVTAISAEAHGEQDKDPPWAYRHIDVVFTVQGPNLDQRAVDRALTLAFEGYCSVGATLAGTATVTHRAVVKQPEAIRGRSLMDHQVLDADSAALAEIIDDGFRADLRAWLEP